MKISWPWLQTPTLSHTQFQSHLATWFIWTHSGRIHALPYPVVAKTPHSLAVGFGRMSRYLSATYCFLMNTAHPCPTGLKLAHMRCIICAGHLDTNIYPISPSTISTIWACPRSTWHAFVPGLCDSLCNDAIICSCSRVIEGNTEGWGSDKGQKGIYWCLQHEKCWINSV